LKNSKIIKSKLINKILNPGPTDYFVNKSTYASPKFRFNK